MREIKLVLATSWEPDREAFFAKMGIGPGRLARQLFDPVYDCLFVDAEDARREFTSYYSVEYETLETYLEARHGVMMDASDLEKEHIFLPAWLPNVIDDAWDGNALNEVLEAVDALEREHEDQG